MIFFFKKTKIVVDAFTLNDVIAKQYPIEPAIKNTPNWWKALPSELPRDPQWPLISMLNMKRCVGFVEEFKRSYVLPLWTDITVEMQRGSRGLESRYMCADGLSTMEIHDQSQYKGYVDANQYQHYKLRSPWLLFSKSDIFWNFHQASWHHGDWLGTMNILPGQVDFKFQHVVHINMLLRNSDTGRTSMMLPAGLPMVMLSPRTEKEVDLRVHSVTMPEFNRMLYMPKFSGLYKENKDKCPFH